MPYQLRKKKIFYIGEDGSGVKQRFSTTPQNYSIIRKECFKLKQKFEDPEFPIDPKSIGYIDIIANKNIKIENLVWRRPQEIVGTENKAYFFVENDVRDGGTFTRFDINQGTLGDCWFLVAIANITLQPKLLEFIIPKDNSLDDKDYCGAFHFRYWHKGIWLDVVIDDRLPCVWNSEKEKYQLIFLQSHDNEFWPALLEKAYAKLMGSYQIIEAGLPSEAMEDFSGGIWEIFYLDKDRYIKNMFQTLLGAHERGTFIAAATGPNENLINAGLVMSHAYSVTSVKRLKTSSGAYIELLRLRNPWGNSMEWRGAWGDDSKEWNEIKEETRKELGLTFRDDGEFWIEFNDLQKHFTYLHACHLSPEALDSKMNEPKWKKWNCTEFVGIWNRDKFASESQHIVTVGHYHDTEHTGTSPKGTLIITVMNKNISLSGKVKSPEYGFELYRVEHQKFPFQQSFFKNAQMEGRESTKIGMREVGLRFHLDPATYCIIPFCKNPEYTGQYLLRVVSEKQHLVPSDHSYQKSIWNCNFI